MVKVIVPFTKSGHLIAGNFPGLYHSWSWYLRTVVIPLKVKKLLYGNRKKTNRKESQ